MNRIDRPIFPVKQEENLFTEVQQFNGLKGWWKELVGSAIRVEEDNGNTKRTFYLDKKSLVQKLFINENKDYAAFKGLENVARVHELLIRTLNPIKGKPILVETVQKVFSQFRKQKVLDNLQEAETHKPK